MHASNLSPAPLFRHRNISRNPLHNPNKPRKKCGNQKHQKEKSLAVYELARICNSLEDFNAKRRSKVDVLLE
jgi:hypothetical protein